MKIEIIRPNESRALRFCLLAGKEQYKVEDCRMILPNENVLRDPVGDSSGPHLYLISGPIGNFSYNYAMLWEGNESDALDAAADLDLLERLKMDDSSDEGSHLGNDGHLFDLTDVIVSRIPAKGWQQDLDYILAIGRSMENPNLTTWADI
jgi:hypothetical protein